MKYQNKNKIIFTFIILQTIKYISSNIEPIKVKPFEKIYFNNSNEILIEFNNQIPDNYTSDLPPDILINIELNEYIDLTVDISTAKTLEILFSNETDPLTKNIYHGYSILIFIIFILMELFKMVVLKFQMLLKKNLLMLMNLIIFILNKVEKIFLLIKYYLEFIL